MRLQWEAPPRTVLIVMKPHDPDILSSARLLEDFLVNECDCAVLYEQNVIVDTKNSVASALQPPSGPTISWSGSRPGSLSLPPTFRLSAAANAVDFVITLGGDGTVLHASQLYPKFCPPILAFHFGSLGFLAPFSRDEVEDAVNLVLDNRAPVQMRMRLRVQFDEGGVENSSEWPSAEPLQGADVPSAASDAAAGTELTALNEVVLERGSSPYLSNIECYVDDEFVTTVSADGLIIATPTGSTAYSLSAGGSIVHPGVPALLLTPICPHSLSFRPLILPDAAVITLKVPMDSRGSAWASVDGRNRREVSRGQTITISASQHGFPSIVRVDDGSTRRSTWFRELAECLSWNLREKQRAFK